MMIRSRTSSSILRFSELWMKGQVPLQSDSNPLIDPKFHYSLLAGGLIEKENSPVLNSMPQKSCAKPSNRDIRIPQV